MKKIIHNYGADLDWVDNLAQSFGGYVKDNFIIVPESIHSGIRYFLKCSEGIVALYIDVTYNTDVQLFQTNKNKDFIGIYYNLTEGEANLSADNMSNSVGRWSYNLSVVDSTLDSTYNVKKGSRTYVLCIFIKKEVIRSYINDIPVFRTQIDKIMNPKTNTFIRFDRMTNDSYHALNDLRKFKVGGPVFDLNLMSTVNLLISDHVLKVSREKLIIQTVNEYDLAGIVKVQSYLIDNIEDRFPSVESISKLANMSESKFKELFRKITGCTPNHFFMTNKLLRAKELLEKRQLSISQVSDMLNFTNNSYFASKFKENFGISPKKFIQKL